MSLALIGSGIFLGIVFLGLWGDVVIGAVMVAAAGLVEAAAKTCGRAVGTIRRRPSRAPAERRAPATVGQR